MLSIMIVLIYISSLSVYMCILLFLLFFLSSFLMILGIEVKVFSPSYNLSSFSSLFKMFSVLRLDLAKSLSSQTGLQIVITLPSLSRS